MYQYGFVGCKKQSTQKKSCLGLFYVSSFPFQPPGNTGPHSKTQRRLSGAPPSHFRAQATNAHQQFEAAQRSLRRQPPQDAPTRTPHSFPQRHSSAPAQHRDRTATQPQVACGHGTRGAAARARRPRSRMPKPTPVCQCLRNCPAAAAAAAAKRSCRRVWTRGGDGLGRRAPDHGPDRVPSESRYFEVSESRAPQASRAGARRACQPAQAEKGPLVPVPAAVRLSCSSVLQQAREREGGGGGRGSERERESECESVSE